MATPWMQMDLDLPEKPEFRQIMALSGEPAEVVFWRLFQFWRWVERHTTDGFFPGFTAEMLADLLGGTPDFWRSLADERVDWLWIREDGIEVARWEERFSQAAKNRAKNAQTNAKKRRKPAVTKTSDAIGQKSDLNQSQRKNKNITDQTDQSAPAVPTDPSPPPADRRGADADRTDLKEFSSEGERRTTAGREPGERAKKPPRRAPKTAKEDPGQRRMFTEVELSRVNEMAEELLRQSGYSGKDGGIFFEAAAVLEVNPGPLTRHALVDAARGCREMGAGNPPGYFRASVRNLCPDFEQRLKGLGVWITRRPERSPAPLGTVPTVPPAEMPVAGATLKRPPREPTEVDATEEIRRKVLAQLEHV